VSLQAGEHLGNLRAGGWVGEERFSSIRSLWLVLLAAQMVMGREIEVAVVRSRFGIYDRHETV